MRHPKGCLIFYGMDTGLEESGPPEGRVKKCPVDTFLARGRVPRRKAQVGAAFVPCSHPGGGWGKRLSPSQSLRDSSPRVGSQGGNGLPRQCAHCLAMTCVIRRFSENLRVFPHPSRLRRATFTLRSNCHWQLLDLESLRGAPPRRGRLGARIVLSDPPLRTPPPSAEPEWHPAWR